MIYKVGGANADLRSYCSMCCRRKKWSADLRLRGYIMKPDFNTLKKFILSILPMGVSISDETIRKINEIYSKK